MKRTANLSFVVVSLGLLATDPALGDWTMALPGPRSNEGLDVTPATRFGAIAVWRNSPQESRLAWFSTSGELLLDYSFDAGEFGSFGGSAEYVYILNSTQLLIYGDGKFRHISLTGGGKFSTKDYVLTSSQRSNVYLKDHIAADLTGFYYTDSVTWTISRVDFPKPSSGAIAAAGLALQSAPSPAGPWATLEEIEVPAPASREFFRLEIRR